MFAEVKESLSISGDDYDAQIIREIKACALDLTTSAEIVLPGAIVINRTKRIIAATTSEPETYEWVITDGSTVTDELIIAAISTWCNMRIGNPPNYEQLLKAYNSLKGQLRLSNNYTKYGNGTEDEDDEDADQL